MSENLVKMSGNSICIIMTLLIYIYCNQAIININSRQQIEVNKQIQAVEIVKELQLE